MLVMVAGCAKNATGSLFPEGTRSTPDPSAPHFSLPVRFPLYSPCLSHPVPPHLLLMFLTLTPPHAYCFLLCKLLVP